MASTAGSYRALARKAATLPERVVRAGAEAMSEAIVAELKADTGGDQILSGVRRRGRRSKLATTTTITGGVHIATATVAASPRRARGQWAWLEAGTNERVAGRLLHKTAGPGGKHMKVGDQWFTGPWSTGRMTAKHTFSDGVRRGTPDAERAMAAVFDREMKL